MSPLHDTLRLCAAVLPEEFRAAHERLLLDEHLAKLAGGLESLHRDGVPPERPLPHFAAECTPPPAESFAFFRTALAARAAAADPGDPAVVRALADALVAAGTRHLLL